MASPKTLYRRAAARADMMRTERPLVVNPAPERLMKLMREFFDAETRNDEDAMKLLGRGLSGYTRAELNAAERAVLAETKRVLH